MQSRTQSLIEICSNIFTGWVMSLLLAIVFFPYFGINISLEANLQISTIFTVASIIRSYIFRRFFNYLTIKKVLREKSNDAPQNL